MTRRTHDGERRTGERRAIAARAAIALAATLAIQIYVSFAATAAAVLAPEIARDFGIAPRWVGVFVGIVYAGAMFASLACGSFIERHGAIRVSQACVLLCAIGVRVDGGRRRRARRRAARARRGRDRHRLRTDHARVVAFAAANRRRRPAWR